MTALVSGIGTTPAAESKGKSELVYIGTYTGRASKGIYRALFDPKKGSLSAPVLACETVNPTFLAVHPNKKWLYAANETQEFDGKRTGAISAFSIDRNSGQLTLLNQKPSAGTGPCHVSVDKSGRCVLAANYGSGSVATFKIDPDGRLSDTSSVIQNEGSSVNPQRQAGPHAHHIAADPANRFVLACDLGIDKVLVWALSPEAARLTAHEPGAITLKPGSGPRHLTFDPKGRFIYLVNELNSTLTTFSYEGKNGKLSELTTISTLPERFQGNNSGAEIQIHPAGRYVYSSNRGENSIAIFALENRTGVPRYIGSQSSGGRTPRHFAIHPTGRWLVAENQDSNNIVVFQIDKSTGLLTPVGNPIEVGAPVCLVFAD